VNRRPLLLLALAFAACRSDSQAYPGLSAGTTAPPTSLLRLPAAGGTAQLYRLPDLEIWGWKAGTALPPLRRPVGADLDLGVVYALGIKNEVVAFDLQTGRPRIQLAGGVREAVMGPDGTLHTVDDSLRLVQFVHRNPVRINQKLSGRPRDLFGSRNSVLLAITSNVLSIFRGEDPPVPEPLPAGDASATYWGDLLAIAADTAVILIDTDTPDKPVSIPVAGHARAVLFSPSGHRFYVARREGSVLVFNRFSHAQVAEIKLPGPAAALRSDPFGRWLMVNPSRDSLWLVDLSTNRYVGSFATVWASDLPTITNQQSLLVKTGGDVVSYNLTQKDFPERGRIKGGADDFWIPLAWTPETGTASIAVDVPLDSAAVPGDSADTAAQVYLQVSSSQNKDWSADLARQLEQQGLPASVLSPRGGDDGFRVVLGPYPTREAAEATGKRLGRPYFIYQPDR
jgi:hypothetical protein